MPLLCALRRRKRFSVRQSREATHRVNSDSRRLDALVTEMPTPLNSATYMAIQTGHLGSKTSVALGMSHPASSPPRRQRDAGRRALSPSRIALWQSWQVFTRVPPPFDSTSRLSDRTIHTG